MGDRKCGAAYWATTRGLAEASEAFEDAGSSACIQP